MTDVPVCAGRGSQPRCKYYRANGSEPAVRWCTALYNVVTGEAVLRRCEDVRGDQDTCGRKGELYDPIVTKTVQRIISPANSISPIGNAREDLG